MLTPYIGSIPTKRMMDKQMSNFLSDGLIFMKNLRSPLYFFAMTLIVSCFFSEHANATPSPVETLTFSPKKLDENGQVGSVGAGHFRDSVYDDLIYIDVSGDLNFRSSSASSISDTSGNFHGSALVDSSVDHLKIWSVDVNADGYDDVVTTSTLAASQDDYQTSQIHVFMSNGSSSSSSTSGATFFEPPQTFTLSTSTLTGSTASQSLADIDFGDFDGDGDLDMVITATGVSSVSETDDDKTNITYTNQSLAGIRLNSGAGYGTTALTLTQTEASQSGTDAAIYTSFFSGKVAAGDFNTDGKIDVGVCYSAPSFTPPSSVIYPGNGNGTVDYAGYATVPVQGCKDGAGVRPFGPFSTAEKYASGLANSGTSDNYGRYVIIENNDGRIFFYSKNWDDATGSGTRIQNTQLGQLGPFTDFNNDGSADFMFLDGHNSEVVAGWDWTNNDSRYIPNPPDITLGSGTQSGDYGDFNGDGWPDAIGFDDNDNIMIYMNLATPTN